MRNSLRSKRTYTPEEDWEKFKMIHTGKNSGKYNTEKWIEQYEPIIAKYPKLRLYGWHKAVKWYCEEHGYHSDDEYEVNSIKMSPQHKAVRSWLRPKFMPDLYLICTEFIACIEIEDYSRWSKYKERALTEWVSKMDEFEAVPIYIYRFDRYGNYQNIIYPDVEENLQMSIDYTDSYEPTEDGEKQIMRPFADGHKNTWNEHVLSGKLIDEALEQICIAQEILIDIENNQGENNEEYNNTNDRLCNMEKT